MNDSLHLVVDETREDLLRRSLLSHRVAWEHESSGPKRGTGTSRSKRQAHEWHSYTIRPQQCPRCSSPVRNVRAERRVHHPRARPAGNGGGHKRPGAAAPGGVSGTVSSPVFSQWVRARAMLGCGWRSSTPTNFTVGVYGDAHHVAVLGRHALLWGLPRRIRGEYLVPWIAVVVHQLEEAVRVDDGADEPVRERRGVGVLLRRRVMDCDDFVRARRAAFRRPPS